MKVDHLIVRIFLSIFLSSLSIQWKSFLTSYLNIANNNESKLSTSALYIYIFFIIFYVKKFRLFYYYDEDETFILIYLYVR